MLIGKHISLREARQQNNLDLFIQEHPSNGDKEQFDDLLNNMTHNIKPKKPLRGGKTLTKE